MPQIHSTAVIAESAKIGAGTTIGPYSCIGPYVKIGKNCRVSSHVVIEGFTEIGDENKIYQFASVGAEPQDLKWDGEPTKLVVGDRNIIREYVTMQPGLKQFEAITVVGSNNLFMACSHVAHDVIIGDNNWITNSAGVAGHVNIGSKVIIGAMSGVHQFCRIGHFAFIAAGAMVVQDVPPYCLVQGDRARLKSINKIGLVRAGFSKDDIRKIHNIFKILFVRDGIMRERIQRVEDNYTDFIPAKEILEFIKNSERGTVSY